MNKSQNQNLEGFIEHTPNWLKSSYISMMQCFKKILHSLGLLSRLDKHAKRSRHVHYLRSLLAIYQLDDMIQLDVPWWTYSAIAAIEKHIQTLGYKPAVFEYGSGASTIWLAKRAQSVISIEHNYNWFQQLKSKLIAYPNVQLIYKAPNRDNIDPLYSSHKMKNVDFKAYVSSIEETSQLFDLIIIDGRCRENCLKASLAYLKPNGIIIFDNSNRKRYQKVLLSFALRIQRYYGLVPGSPFKSETSLLFKS
jgi:hypothetical protein